MINFMQEFKTRANHLLEVRYEDILAQPRQQMEGLREFCELAEVSDRTLLYCQKIEQIGNVRHGNSHGNFDLIESICSKNMKIYGY